MPIILGRSQAGTKRTSTELYTAANRLGALAGARQVNVVAHVADDDDGKKLSPQDAPERVQQVMASFSMVSRVYHASPGPTKKNGRDCHARPLSGLCCDQCLDITNGMAPGSISPKTFSIAIVWLHAPRVP